MPDSTFIMKAGQTVLNYRLRDELWKAGVWAAESVTDGTTVVVKTFDSIECFQRERDAMLRLADLEGIARLLAHSTEVHGHSGVLVLEFYPHKDLISLIAGQSYNSCEESVRDMFVSIARAVKRCHERGIAHLDIKPDNIVLDGNDRPVLIDFGHARVASNCLLTAFTSTRGYQAPEIEKGLKYDGFKADIYSLGVMLYAMRMRTIPTLVHKANTDGELGTHREVKYRRENTVTPQLKDLINQMMSTDPAQRPDISGLLSHPWITG